MDKLPTVGLKGVEIFAVGKWTDSKGRSATFTEEDLDAMVTAFDKTKDSLQPVLMIGHGKQNHPAIGRMTALRRIGKKLVADFGQVPQKLGQLIVAGAFPKRSAEIVDNATIGGKVWNRAVTAVALLGAKHPALDNLADITDLYSLPEGMGGEAFGYSLQDGQEPGTTFQAIEGDLAEDQQTATQGGDEMSKELENKLEDERKARLAAEKRAEESDAKFEKEAEERKKADDERRKADIEARKGEGKASLEQAFKDGKFAPVVRPFMEQLINIAAESDTVLKFAAKEGDSPEDVTGVQIFTRMVDAAPTVLEFGKTATGPTEDPDGTGTPDKDVRDTVHRKVKAFQKESNSDISYIDALDAVLEADPTLAKKYDDAE